MKRLFAFVLLMAVVAACSDDSNYIPVCNCEPDEYCVDDKCYPTDSTIAPAPVESEQQ